MEELKAALHALTESAQPPAVLSLLRHDFRTRIDENLISWKQDVLERFAQQEPTPRGAKKAYRRFVKQVTAYSAWFQKALGGGRVLHHDVYVALVSLNSPTNPPAS